MNDAEKRIRALLGGLAEWPDVAEGIDALDALATEHKAALAAARDAALEEASREGKFAVLAWMGGTGPGGNCAGYTAERIRALKSRPAERYLPEAKVQWELSRMYHDPKRGDVSREACVTLARCFGVDLDAKDDMHPIFGPALVPFCPKCHHPAHLSARTYRNGTTATPCPCLSTTLPGRVAASKAESECEGSPDCGWHNGGPCAACKAKAEGRNE